MQHNPSKNRSPGKDMLGQTDIQFEIAQHPRRNESRNQDCRHHGRDYDVEQVVAGVERRDGDHQRDQRIDNSRPGYVVIEVFA